MENVLTAEEEKAEMDIVGNANKNGENQAIGQARKIINCV